MGDEAIFIKKGGEKSRIKKPGKLHKLMIKSDKIEAILFELNSSSESRWYQHEGEELHLVPQGKMGYTVGEKSYKMDEGDSLWHRSMLKHRAKNISNKKVVHITAGPPPTFV